MNKFSPLSSVIQASPDTVEAVKSVAGAKPFEAQKALIRATESISAYDGDSPIIDGQSTRYKSLNPRVSLDTYEVGEDIWDNSRDPLGESFFDMSPVNPPVDKRTVQQKIKFDKQLTARAKFLQVPTEEVTKEQFFEPANKAKVIMTQQLRDNPNAEIVTKGKGMFGRPLIDIIGSDGNSLFDAVNTPELNVSYDSKYNVAKQTRDKLEGRVENKKYSDGIILDAFQSIGTGVGRVVDMGLTALPKALSIADTLDVTNKDRKNFADLTELAKQRRSHLQAYKELLTLKPKDLAEQQGKVAAMSAIGDLLTNVDSQSEVLEDSLERKSPFGFGLTSLGQGSKADSLAREEIVNTMTGIVKESLTNTTNDGGVGEVIKESKDIWGRGTTKINSGMQSSDIVYAAARIADGISDILYGYPKLLVTDPAAMANGFIQSFPQMVATATNPAAALPAITANYAHDAIDTYKQSHEGKHPQGYDMGVLIAASAVAAVADRVGDVAVVKALGGKVNKIAAVASETVTEFVQDSSEQFAGKQDLSTIDYGQAYGASVLAFGGSLEASILGKGAGKADAIVKTGNTKGDGTTVKDTLDTIGTMAKASVTPKEPLSDFTKDASTVIDEVDTLLSEGLKGRTKEEYTKEISKSIVKVIKARGEIASKDLNPADKELVARMMEGAVALNAFKAAVQSSNSDFKVDDHLDRKLDSEGKSRLFRNIGSEVMDISDLDKIDQTDFTKEEVEVVKSARILAKHTKRISEVNAEVIHGSKEKLGVVDHRRLINESDDKQGAYDNFMLFRKGMEDKLSLLTQARDFLKQGRIAAQDEIVDQWSKSFPDSQPLKLGKGLEKLYTSVKAEVDYMYATEKDLGIRNKDLVLTPKSTFDQVDAVQDIEPEVIPEVVQEQEVTESEESLSNEPIVNSEQELTEELSKPKASKRTTKIEQTLSDAGASQNDLFNDTFEPEDIFSPTENDQGQLDLFGDLVIPSKIPTQESTVEQSVDTPSIDTNIAVKPKKVDGRTKEGRRLKALRLAEEEANKQIDPVIDSKGNEEIVPKIPTEQLEPNNLTDQVPPEFDSAQDFGEDIDYDYGPVIQENPEVEFNEPAFIPEDRVEVDYEAINYSIEKNTPTLSSLNPVNIKNYKSIKEAFESATSQDAATLKTIYKYVLKRVPSMARSLMTTGDTVLNNVKGIVGDGFSEASVLMSIREEWKPKYIKSLTVSKSLAHELTKEVNYGLDLLSRTTTKASVNIGTYFQPTTKRVNNLFIQLPNIFEVLDKTNRTEVEQALLSGVNEDQLRQMQPFMGIIGSALDKVYSKHDLKSNVKKNPSILYTDRETGKLTPVVKNIIALNIHKWMTESGRDNLNISDNYLNRLLGRSTQDSLDFFSRKAVQGLGTTRSGTIEKLGKAIYSMIPMDIKENTDGLVEFKMVSSLGATALLAMDKAGIIEHTKAIKSSTHKQLLDKDFVAIREEYGSKFSEEIYNVPEGTASVPFIRLKSDLVDKTKPDKRLRKFYGQASRYGEVLEQVVPELKYKRDIIFKRPSVQDVHEIVRQTGKKVPAKVRRALARYVRDPWEVNRDSLAVFDLVDRDQLFTLLGGDEDYKSMYWSQRLGAKGKNLDINKSIDLVKSLREIDKPFYVMSEMWKIGRAGMLGDINPQQDKLIRTLTTKKAWDGEYKTTEDRFKFKQAFLQAWDNKVEHIPTKEKVNEIFQGYLEDETIQGAVDAIRKGEKSPLIMEALKGADDKAHGLHALAEMAKYDDSKPFTSNLTIEIDGITNGVAIGVIQFGAIAPSELHRFGIMTDNKQSYAEYASKKENKDSYEGITYLMHQEVSKIDEIIPEFIKEAMGSFLDEDGNVTSRGRKLSKYPLMTATFGRGLKAISKSMAYDFVQDNFLPLIVNATEQEYVDLLERMDNYLVMPEYKDRLDTDINFSRIQQLVEDTYGKALINSIESLYGSFMRQRTQLNLMVAMQNEIYKMKYKVEEDKIIEENNLPSSYRLNSIQKEQVQTKLEKSFPQFKPVYGDEDGGSNLYLGSEGRVKTEAGNEDYTVTVSSASTLSNGKSSASTTVADTVWEDVGVSPSIKNIHSSDAGVQYKLMELFPMLNVHDAIVAGAKQSISLGQAQNKAFFEVMSDFSAMESTYNALLESTKDLTPEQTTKLDLMTQATKQTDPDNYMSSFFHKRVDKDTTSPKYTDFNNYVEQMKNHTELTNRYKQRLLDSMVQVTQYSLPDAHYTPVREAVTPDGTQDKAYRIDEQLFTEEWEEAIEEDSRDRNRSKKSSRRGNVNKKGKSKFDTYRSDNRGDDLGEFNDVTDVITGANAKALFEGLVIEGGNSDKHISKLRNMVSTLSTGILNPISLLLKDGLHNSGIYSDNSIYITTNGSGSLFKGDMSPAEIYTHELNHAVVHEGLSTDYFLRKRADQLHRQARKYIDANGGWKVFDEGNPIAAKALYDHMFNNKDEVQVLDNPVTGRQSTRKINHGLDEFIALGSTNEKVVEVFNEIGLEPEPEIKGINVLERLNRLLKAIYNKVFHRITDSSSTNVSDGIRLLTESLTKANIKNASLLDKVLKYNDTAVMIADSKLAEWGSKGVAKTGQVLQDYGYFTKVKHIGGIVEEATKLRFEDYTRASIKIAKRFEGGKDSFIYSIFQDLAGQTAENIDSHELLAESNMYLDQARQNKISNVKSDLLSRFKETLSHTERDTVTKVMLRTNLSKLLELGKDWSFIRNVVSDPVLLNDFIEELKTSVTINNVHGSYLNLSAHNLAHYMVHGVPARDGLKMNPSNIVSMVGTGYSTDVSEDAEAKVTELTILHAIAETPLEDKKAFSKIANKEFEDSEENGISFAGLFANHVANRAFSNNFSDSPENYVFGYLPEITDSRVQLEVSNDPEDKKLLDDNFTRVHDNALTDPVIMPIQGNRYLYINTLGVQAGYLEGSVSLANRKSKGTSIIELIEEGTYKDKKAKATVIIDNMNKTLKTIVKSDKFKTNYGKDTIYVPIQSNGKIVDYRLMMARKEKDDLLNPNLDFATLLGTADASVDFKTNSEEINTKAVNLLYEDFMASSEDINDLKDFIHVGKNAASAEGREMFARLPNPMKQAIRGKWGNQDIYVRESLYKIFLGQRKWSVSQLPTGDIIDADTLTDKLLTGLGNVINRPKVIRAEALAIEIGKEVKDAIVIKSGSTLYGNVVSNNWLLWISGMNHKEILSKQLVGLDAILTYQKDAKKLDKLQRENALGIKDHSSAIANLESYLQQNPVAPLIDSAMYQTLIEDVVDDDPRYTDKGLIIDKIAPYIAKIPKPIRKAADIAYMGHNTDVYKFMKHSTQVSDLVARYALFSHLTDKGEMTDREITSRVRDTFINYDLPAHQSLTYANDTLFAMFTKFYMRIQKIIAVTSREAPAKFIGLLMLENLFNEQSTIDDSFSNPLNKVNLPVSSYGEPLSPHTIDLFL